MCSPFIKPPWPLVWAANGPHWLANSELKPLPLPPPRKWPVSAKGPEVGDSFWNTLGKEADAQNHSSSTISSALPTCFLSSSCWAATQDAAVQPLSLIVSVCASHSFRLKTNLACDYEWKCRNTLLDNSENWPCPASSLWAGSILLAICSQPLYVLHNIIL